MLDSPEFHLNPGLKKLDIHKAFTEVLQRENPDVRVHHSPSYTTKILQEDFPNIKRRKWVRFTKCSTCCILDDKISQCGCDTRRKGNCSRCARFNLQIYKSVLFFMLAQYVIFAVTLCQSVWYCVFTGNITMSGIFCRFINLQFPAKQVVLKILTVYGTVFISQNTWRAYGNSIWRSRQRNEHQHHTFSRHADVHATMLQTYNRCWTSDWHYSGGVYTATTQQSDIIEIALPWMNVFVFAQMARYMERAGPIRTARSSLHASSSYKHVRNHTCNPLITVELAYTRAPHHMNMSKIAACSSLINVRELHAIW